MLAPHRLLSWDFDGACEFVVLTDFPLPSGSVKDNALLVTWFIHIKHIIMNQSMVSNLLASTVNYNQFIVNFVLHSALKFSRVERCHLHYLSEGYSVSWKAYTSSHNLQITTSKTQGPSAVSLVIADNHFVLSLGIVRAHMGKHAHSQSPRVKDIFFFSSLHNRAWYLCNTAQKSQYPPCNHHASHF